SKERNSKTIYPDLQNSVFGDPAVNVLAVSPLGPQWVQLQLDYVDIVFANRSDVNAPMEGQNPHSPTAKVCAGFAVPHGSGSVAEIVRAMTFVIDQGLAMYWGTSRWNVSCVLSLQGYSWLKERLHSDEGKKQLSKIKELHLLADRLNCTAAQLAIGTAPPAGLQTRCIIIQVMCDDAMMRESPQLNHAHSTPLHSTPLQSIKASHSRGSAGAAFRSSLLLPSSWFWTVSHLHHLLI
ncbi:hypothetical protein XENOCAPTIV_001929, partial [Xenoophorus captivus]